uniref:Paralemmin-1 n=1 Tax=Cynoglossus semilaevis TaxID=244447 RepID=A0A3P8UKK4_CYNSE
GSQSEREKRKLQTEVENKRRQLEDDRRTLQHLKSQAVREQWLLDGASSAGPDQDQTKTRNLEATISRLEQELVSLETGTHTNRSRSDCMSLCLTAVYSVEITVERDKSTGETRVLSTNTKLPVDLSYHGIKVYEDEQKVVHEMNGEDGGHQLSCSEVEELIHKADEASMMSQTVDTVSSLPAAEVQEEEGLVREPPSLSQKSIFPVEIPGLEARPAPESSVAEASTENPVTMVFMGYQSVEDEAETKRVLGLQGTVKAELVIIDDGLPPLISTPQPTATKPPESMMAKTKEAIKEMPRNEVVKIKKEKQPCKCCTIM